MASISFDGSRGSTVSERSHVCACLKRGRGDGSHGWKMSNELKSVTGSAFYVNFFDGKAMPPPHSQFDELKYIATWRKTIHDDAFLKPQTKRYLNEILMWMNTSHKLLKHSTL